MLEFYIRFRSRPVRRNTHVILYQATEYRPNRSTRCGNITSYPFLNMAAATATIFGFIFVDVTSAGLTHKHTTRTLRAPSGKGAPSKSG